MVTNVDIYFEGVEKLLEIWFSSSQLMDDDDRDLDLRNIPRSKIEELLENVKCEVIASMSNDYLDSYVLSESSLFVAKKRFILKTCGTTTPLQCLKHLMLLVETYTAFDTVQDVFYSRKNYKRPELQLSPHRDFEEELDILNSFFPDGNGYILGSPSTNNSWYLFTYNNSNHSEEPDQTCEVLMTDLDPEIMKIFSKEHCRDGHEATIKSGIDRIFPNAVINDHLFDPCGYSMNGVFKNSEELNRANGSYMTIHITPEPDYSYVSFETNAPQQSYKEIIERVLSIFKPGKFIMTLFTNKTSAASGDQEKLKSVTRFNESIGFRLLAHSPIEVLSTPNPLEHGQEWIRVESKYCTLNNYDLTFAHYTKKPS